jgi:AAA domain/UvrD-like helicase C-terminal domain
VTQLPLRHLSIRVPWHDHGWQGTVCNHAKGNAACLALAEIRETKDDLRETELAGQSIEHMPQRQWPACIGERATIMAPFEFTREVKHPYASFSEHHDHIGPAKFRHPAYSAAVIPFRWMSRKDAFELARYHDIDADREREPTDGWLERNNWVQDHHNQRELLDAFFGAIEPERSLCLFYAKQTPMIDDDDRILIGAGRVRAVGPLVDYTYARPGKLRSYVWDRSVEHSVRPDFGDGFLLPYHELLAHAAAGEQVDLHACTALCPADRRAEFSYAGEHVTHDGAIAALLSCRDAIEHAEPFVTVPTGRMLTWIDARLGELWSLRGPTPGLGAALKAFGVERGNLLAYELASALGENESPWALLDDLMAGQAFVSDRAEELLTRTNRDKWIAIRAQKPERRALLELVARFDLTDDQAERFWVAEKRAAAGIEVTDSDLLTNPYLLFERDRMSSQPVSVWTVDRGAFPAPAIRESHPLPERSNIGDPTDRRRVRAMVIESLESAAAEGHTLRARSTVVTTVREYALDPKCPVDGDLLDVVEDSFEPWIAKGTMADGAPSYQLDRLGTAREMISTFVNKRIAGARHGLPHDWMSVLDEKLGDDGLLGDPEEAERERRGREEKATALAEIAASRFSVLVGPAGTGKTTILSALIEQPQIKAGDVLLLAPTGKARVRLETTTRHEAKTLAQFLITSGRYDEATGSYLVTGGDRVQAGKTVVVDEASMLTEEMLASLIDSVRGVERFILVGDPRQLPPIGAGRPFFDIVEHLRPDGVEGLFPRSGTGYAELTVHRRHKGDEPDDVQLARWFSGQALRATDDEIVAKVDGGLASDRVRFVEWTTGEELRDVLLDVVVEELAEVKSRDDVAGFEATLGATTDGEHRYFNRGNTAEAAEAWQILTPVRGLTHGVRDLNRLIQTTFRQSMIDFAHEKTFIPKPVGADQVVYGDKVINLRNHRRRRIYPDDDKALKYVANGEIGIVVGQFKSKNWKGRPWKIEIEFSSQPGYAYGFSGRDFSDEGTASVELAYAITVHKAQGSEFGLTLLVLPEVSRVMSRELLYTALTRQRERIVVIHQGPRAELWKYASDEYSEMKSRLTNLFVAPSLVAVGDRYLEERLIHRSGKGEPMRSKSEIIIADQLAAAGIDYEYETKLIGLDGSTRLPDFTIVDDDSGRTYYWEHCGMLGDPTYAKKWARKLEWYESQKIRPYEDGGGERGALVVTEDDERGGISSQAIKELITKVFA